MSTALNEVALSYRVSEPPGGWLLEVDDVPETPLHDAIIELLMLVLAHRVDTTARDALIARNLGCRWDPLDARVGTDPDVVWIEPAPPEGEDLTTLRVWEPDHHPPRVAIEVVSANTANTDYLEAPPRSGRLGVRELWIFDPRHFGPESTGGPFTLQIWRLDPAASIASMHRIHAGEGPAYSPELDAWLHVTDGGRRLRIASDDRFETPWPTPFEEERRRAEDERRRAEDEQRRAEDERRRAEDERRRADELEAKLRALGVELEK